MRAYPNPNSDVLYIKWYNNQSDASLRLINDMGIVILEKEVNGNSQLTNIPTHNLPEGIYLLEQTQGGERWVQKIVMSKR